MSHLHGQGIAAAPVLLTIAGDGAADFEVQLKKTISGRWLQNHVMMTGRLDGDLKWGAYASAKLFLLPSRQENFAITVVEAMQMGLPVIVSEKVNTWPYVKEAGAGIVSDSDPQREYEETVIKARAMMKALAMASQTKVR